MEREGSIMRHFLSILFWGVVFALLWAAGHDIFREEGGVWLEWAVVIIGFLLAVVALAFRRPPATRGREGHRIRKMKFGGRV
jgi:hypothetical protein